MPFYQITVTLKSQKKITGIRFDEEYNIDRAWQLFEQKARKAIKDMQQFDLVMVSRQSKAYRDWVTAEKKDIK